jgi:amino acid permease
MSLKPEHDDLAEKHVPAAPAYETGHMHSDDPDDLGVVKTNALKQDLKGRHMQMIAM